MRLSLVFAFAVLQLIGQAYPCFWGSGSDGKRWWYYFKHCYRLTEFPTDSQRPGTNANEIHVWSSHITDIKPGALRGYAVLDLLRVARSNLTEVRADMFTGAEKLEILDFQYNQIATVDNGSFASLVNLKQLRLKGNRLTSINGNMWQGLDSLERLDLSENELNSVERKAFYNLPAIREILLASNNISDISGGLYDRMLYGLALDFHPPMLSLMLQDNPLECDDLCWIKEAEDRGWLWVGIYQCYDYYYNDDSEDYVYGQIDWADALSHCLI